MFSAKGKKDGSVYVAGRIDSPKSRQYVCRQCGDDVSHVDATTRSLTISVSEHFRHRKGSDVLHPDKRATWQVGNIMQRLLDNFSDESLYGVETDRIETVTARRKKLDFLVDMMVTEKREDNAKTAIIVESEQFNANDLSVAVEYFSSNNIATMLILSAHGDENRSGKYFRPQYRKHSGKTVRKLTNNELAVYDEIFGRNVYFDHDEQRIKVVKFDDYTEYHDDDKETRSGFVIPAGEREFKTLKLPVVEKSVVGFGIKWYESRNGLILARPEPTSLDILFSAEEAAKASGDEDAAYESGERIAITLDSMSDEKRKVLTRMYGAEKLGGYAVK